MAINYVKGEATQPEGEAPRVITHVCNDIGAWGKGFVVAISKRWPLAEQRYREWNKLGSDGDVPFTLGQVQFVEVEPATWIANILGQHGIRRRGGKPPIRYEALRQGLRGVAIHATDVKASVHMPRIGCGLAGG